MKDHQVALMRVDSNSQDNSNIDSLNFNHNNNNNNSKKLVMSPNLDNQVYIGCNLLYLREMMHIQLTKI
jgi:hypothetical protein